MISSPDSVPSFPAHGELHIGFTWRFMVKSRFTSRVTMLITHIKGLITPPMNLR